MDHLVDLFEREQITLEILAEMGHEDLKQVGVSAYGFRHKILKGIAQLRASTGIYRTNYILDYQQRICPSRLSVESKLQTLVIVAFNI